MLSIRSARFVVTVLMMITLAGVAAPSQTRSKARSRIVISFDAKATAKKLAKAWVETASASNLDSLAQRSIAFSGMIPKVFVTMDGKRRSATQILTENGLTILGRNTDEADAAAMRMIVYALTEIAEGRIQK